MNNRVVVLGSCSVCHVFTAPRLPGEGETLIGGKYHIVVGGKGSGQAVVACKLGSEVYLLERLGDDAHGREERESYVQMGMHTDFVFLDSSAPTGSAGIFLDDAGKNKIVVVPGANARVSCEDIDRIHDVLREATLLGVQLEVPIQTAEYAIRAASALGVRTILDPAPVAPLSEDLFPCVSILKPNENEASTLAGVPVTDQASAIRAAHILLDKGVREAVIITLGEKGTVLVTHDTECYFPAIAVKAIDTGGAGDSFAGGLLAALSRNWSIEKAVCYAQCVSALCVTKTDSYASTDRTAVDALFAEQYPQYC